jgi:outer membrane protein TolC
MPARRLAAAVITLLVVAVPIAAQTPGGTSTRQLSLAQALEQARANSPTYRQSQMNADPAAEAVKAANWARLPTLNVSSGVTYTGVGSSAFGGGFTFTQSSPTVSSSYNFSASWQLSARTFITPSIQRAQQRVTEENIANAGVTLTSDVTSQYLTALRAAAVVGVAVQQLVRDTQFLALAKARQQVGQGTLIDVLSAQTAMASAKVQLLQSQQAATQAKIELLRRIGLPADANVDAIVLSEPFPLVEPKFDLQALRTMANESNPAIRSAQESQRAGHLNTTAARSDRLPSLSISTGLSGYTLQSTNEGILLNNKLLAAQASEANCAFQNEILMGLTTPIQGGIIADCKAYAGLDATGNALLPGVSQAIHTANSVFPFNFTRQPVSVSFGLSLPIWDAYSRSLRVSQAAATEDQARENVRAQQLSTDAQIQSQLLTVNTAWARMQIQDTNRVSARQQLQLAQDRYRIGNGTALEIADAQNAVTQSEADYVTAVYDYHLAVAGLEAAVGRPLR